MLVAFLSWGCESRDLIPRLPLFFGSGDEPDAAGDLSVGQVVADIVDPALHLHRAGVEVVVEHRQDEAAIVAHHDRHLAVERAALVLIGLGARLKQLEVQLAEGQGSEPPVLRRMPEILYGIGNFIENAVDFADTRVTVEGRWDPGNVYIRVIDDGPGFSPEILSRIGEPYTTTRSGTPGQGGLGLGVVGLGVGAGAHPRVPMSHPRTP